MLQRIDVRTLSIILCLAAGAAFAGGGDEALGRVLIEIIGPTVGATTAGTFLLSTEGSKASSHRGGDGEEHRVKECSQTADCHASYVCSEGMCLAVKPAPAHGPATVGATPKDGRCGHDGDCASGLVCRVSYCVEPANTPNACSASSECGAGFVCSQGQCLSTGASLQRQAVQVFLAARAIELREELVFGRGPVITTLAGATAVPAPKLGQALRLHRAELVALIGDGTDAGWSTRFLQRVDALIAG